MEGQLPMEAAGHWEACFIKTLQLETYLPIQWPIIYILD